MIKKHNKENQQDVIGIRQAGVPVVLWIKSGYKKSGHKRLDDKEQKNGRPEYHAIATTAADWVTTDILTSQGSSSLALFDMLFGCIDRCNQGYSDFPAKIFQSVVFCGNNDICLIQQQQSVTCFVGFFQGNLQF